MKKKRQTLRPPKAHQRQREINKETEQIEALLSLLIFFTFLGIFQLIGVIFNIDVLIFMTFHDSGSSIGFLTILPSGFLTYVVFALLRRFSYMGNIIEVIKKTHIKLQKYPRLYILLKFIYKHPIWSYLIALVIYLLVEVYISNIFP